MFLTNAITKLTLHALLMQGCQSNAGQRNQQNFTFTCLMFTYD